MRERGGERERLRESEREREREREREIIRAEDGEKWQRSGEKERGIAVFFFGRKKIERVSECERGTRRLRV